MAQDRIEINESAFVDLLKSGPVMAELMKRARRIASAAGPGKWDVTPSHTPTRARVSVGTGDYTARKAEATNRSLTKALDAGRG